MKKALLFLSLVFFYSVSYSQPDSLMFLDISKAQIYAAEHEKNILIVFAGSDWCRPCIQFKKEILESEDFISYATSDLIILYLDFPAKKINKLPIKQITHNENLAEKYNPQGAFPKIILVDKDAKILGNLDFKNQANSVFVDECKAILEQ